MTNRYLFIWLYTLVITTSLCQHQKNVFIIIASIIATIGCIVAFFLNRVRSYAKKRVPHHKLMIFYEMFAIISVTCCLMILTVFFWNKNDGVYVFIYLALSLPIIPIMINTVRVNTKK